MFDLLSLSARRRILAEYSQYIDQDDIDTVFWLYHYGRRFAEGRLDPRIDAPGEHAWDDAEQFLEILDSARNDAAKATAVDSLLSGLGSVAANSTGLISEAGYPRLDAFRRNPRPRAYPLAAMTRRIVAASCCTFLQGITTETARQKERWLPYQQWLGSLRQEDTIITFNYDLVVELLQPYVDMATWGVYVSGVEESFEDKDANSLRRAKHLPTLLKLHGSVNWQIENEKTRRASWTPAMLKSGIELAIATPGDSKMQLAGGLFRKLWAEAEAALTAADEIIVIGFRFPASDAFPRDRILDAIGRNGNGLLKIEVVLGPDQNADLKRTLALLGWTTGQQPVFDLGEFRHGQRALVARSMWAEDYLGIWARREAKRINTPIPTTHLASF